MSLKWVYDLINSLYKILQNLHLPWYHMKVNAHVKQEIKNSAFINSYENVRGDVFPKIKSVFTNTNFFVVSLNSTFFCLFRIEANRHFALIRFNFFVLSCLMINQKNLEINTPNLKNKKVFKINHEYKVFRIQWSTTNKFRMDIIPKK